MCQDNRPLPRFQDHFSSLSLETEDNLIPPTFEENQLIEEPFFGMNLEGRENHDLLLEDLDEILPEVPLSYLSDIIEEDSEERESEDRQRERIAHFYEDIENMPPPVNSLEEMEGENRVENEWEYDLDLPDPEPNEFFRLNLAQFLNDRINIQPPPLYLLKHGLYNFSLKFPLPERLTSNSYSEERFAEVVEHLDLEGQIDLTILDVVELLASIVSFEYFYAEEIFRLPRFIKDLYEMLLRFNSMEKFDFTTQTEFLGLYLIITDYEYRNRENVSVFELFEANRIISRVRESQLEPMVFPASFRKHDV